MPTARLLFNKPVAAVRVVVDPLLFPQFLDLPKSRLRVRSNTLIRMEQNFLQTTVDAHVLVLGQIIEQPGETLLQAQRNVHSLDFDWRARIEHGMPER